MEWPVCAWVNKVCEIREESQAAQRRTPKTLLHWAGNKYCVMPAYVITEVTYHDPSQQKAYQQLSPVSIAAYDGRFVVRGGAMIPLEGNWNPERIVVLEFPSAARAREWWNSEEYKIAKSIRQSAANTRMIIVDGVPTS